MRLAWIALVLTACSPSPRATIDASGTPPASDAAAVDASSAAPDPVTALQHVPPVCYPSAWCWLLPTPMGNRWWSTFALAPDDLWLSGEDGYLLHWTGAAWTAVTPPTPPPDIVVPLNFEISGRSTHDLWFVTSKLAYHYDGTAFTLRASLPLSDIRTFSTMWQAPDSEDLWLTTGETMFHAVGSGDFTPDPRFDGSSTVDSIWGTSSADFWVSESPAAMLHYDGSAFSSVDTGLPRPVLLVGTTGNDIWGMGNDGLLAHYDGTTWSQLSFDGATPLMQMAVAHHADPDDVWILGLDTAPHAITLHWDGTALTSYPQPFIQEPIALAGLTQVAGRLWAPAQAGALYTQEPATTQVLPVLFPSQQSLTAVWADPDGTFWAAGLGTILHVVDPPITSESIGDQFAGNAISGARLGDAVDILAVGQRGAIEHFDGTTWTASTLDGNPWLTGVWVGSMGHALIVGSGGAAWRWDLGTLTPITTNVTSDLYAVWGPDPDHAYLVGDGGLILAWSSATPDVVTPVMSPTTTNFRAIHGAGGMVWLAGDRLWQGDFTAGFTDVTPPDALGLTSVFAISATDVLAGTGKNLYHSDGTGFTVQQLGAATQTAIIVAGTANARIAVTSNGAILVHP